MCSTGTSKRPRAHSIRSLRASPKRDSGRQEIRTSAGLKARTASSRASGGSGSRTVAVASTPKSCEHLLGDLDAAQRRVADLVGVDDLAGDGLVLRRGQRDVPGAGVDALADRREQLAAAGDLVEEGEDGAALADRESTLGH